MSDASSGEALQLEVEPDLHGRVVVVAHGVIDLREVPDLYGVLMRVCELEPPAVVVDLTDVTFLGSSGLGVFVQVQQELARRHRPLVVRGASPSIRKAFEITQLDRLVRFEYAEDLVDVDLNEAGAAGPQGASA